MTIEGVKDETIEGIPQAEQNRVDVLGEMLKITEQAPAVRVTKSLHGLYSIGEIANPSTELRRVIDVLNEHKDVQLHNALTVLLSRTFKESR